MNYGWCKIIEGTFHCYQNYFNMSIIVAQLSEYNDILNTQIISKSINGHKNVLHSSNIKVTVEKGVLEDSSAIINSLE